MMYRREYSPWTRICVKKPGGQNGFTSTKAGRMRGSIAMLLVLSRFHRDLHLRLLIHVKIFWHTRTKAVCMIYLRVGGGGGGNTSAAAAD